ncbi:hypothetical protein ACFU5O_18290 [Streptomyces sp. NPDC057445]|uniref:hypothetical protein n=1 Tax=Streptomyces sp. NPDC057445 TaxID=3346136 RepID=UPI0036B9DB1B
MKMRHVRAIAVFGLVVITLTGARGSRGGGCDNDHSSGSSSSSGGGSGHYDDDDGNDGGTSGGSGSGGSDATATPTGGTATGSADATGDVEFKYCSIDPAAAHLRGHLYITNSASTDQTYDITVQFEGDSPSAAPVVETIDDLTVAAVSNHTMDVEVPYTGTGKGTDSRDCKVVSATRTTDVS